MKHNNSNNWKFETPGYIIDICTVNFKMETIQDNMGNLYIEKIILPIL